MGFKTKIGYGVFDGKITNKQTKQRATAQSDKYSSHIASVCHLLQQPDNYLKQAIGLF